MKETRRARKLKNADTINSFNWEHNRTKHEEEVNAIIRDIQLRKDEIMQVIMWTMIKQMKTRRGRTLYITMDETGVYECVGEPISLVIAKIDDSVIDEQDTLENIAEYLLQYMPDFYKKANDIYNHTLLIYSKYGEWRE